jgi:hypothetical protein
MMSSQFPEHVAYHERRLEQQTLDALLRIEVVLKALLAHEDRRQPQPPAPPEPIKGKRK